MIEVEAIKRCGNEIIVYLEEKGKSTPLSSLCQQVLTDYKKYETQQNSMTETKLPEGYKCNFHRERLGYWVAEIHCPSSTEASTKRDLWLSNTVLDIMRIDSVCVLRSAGRLGLLLPFDLLTGIEPPETFKYFSFDEFCMEIERLIAM